MTYRELGRVYVGAVLLALGTSARAAVLEGAWQSAVAMGGRGSDTANAVAMDGQGNLYVAGGFTLEAAFGTNLVTSRSGTDVFLAKYTPTGQCLWVRTLDGGTGLDGAGGLAVDSGGTVYLTGELGGLTSPGSAFLAKYSATGDPMRIDLADGDSGSRGLAVALDPSGGGVVVAGQFAGTVFFGSQTLRSVGYEDAFVVKYDANGQVVWARQGAGGWFDRADGVAVAGDGTVFVAGSVYGPADFDGLRVETGGQEGGFVAKYGAGGAIEWVRALGVGDGQFGGRALRVAADGRGGVLVTGQGVVAGANSGAFVARLDAAGQFDWSHTLGGAVGNGMAGLGVMAQGEVLVGGFFFGTSSLAGMPLYASGYTDFYVARFSPGGALLGVRQAGGDVAYAAGREGEWLTAMAVDGVGNCAVAGYFRPTTAFDAITLRSAGEEDGFVARFAVVPLIVQQPKDQRVLVGQDATFGVGVSGAGPFSYQWYKGETAVTGANQAVLTLRQVGAGDAGSYRVEVRNNVGSAVSAAAVLSVDEEGVAIALHPVLTIAGEVGRTYSVQYATDLAPDLWTTLTQVTLAAPIQTWMDPEPVANPRRFYRAVPVAGK